MFHLIPNSLMESILCMGVVFWIETCDDTTSNSNWIFSSNYAKIVIHSYNWSNM
ncbi:hypothetical protein KC19_11G107900 [Ceratodon purpureus]|uniref:Uncharacterized protein n=1 Tax=Ceratodon purpureus TaxID=3225 RepID=A0A8T0GER9_CERPU|nr:hypothetical protein KC19_11G107900 [Ceratodon purpureus]